MLRRTFLALTLSQAGCVRKRKPALARAAEFLWKQQAADGGWHSHTYGLLRSGQSLTPFVLDALLRVPESLCPAPAADVDRALAFLRSQTRRDGALGVADPDIADYPNYATALAVSALCRARRPGWQEQIQPMVAWLRGQQFTEQNGWSPRDPAYGAWGMGGERRTPPGTGHVDLSMTRHVLEALRAAGLPPSDPLFTAARVYVSRCQNLDTEGDGGFFFTTTEFDTNKAGHDGRRFRSYGTATADGILALLSTGCSLEDRRVAAARQWLAARHHGADVPGFQGEAYRRWPRGLAFYYASVVAEAAPSAGNLIESLERAERPDGSWANPEMLVKEDDPLIATPFAVRALAAAVS